VAVEITGAYDVAPMIEVVVAHPFETLLHASQRAADRAGSRKAS